MERKRILEINNPKWGEIKNKPIFDFLSPEAQEQLLKAEEGKGQDDRTGTASATDPTRPERS